MEGSGNKIQGGKSKMRVYSQNLMFNVKLNTHKNTMHNLWA